MRRFQTHFSAGFLLTLAIGCGDAPVPEPPATQPQPTAQAPPPEQEQQPVSAKKPPPPVRPKLRDVGRAEEMAMKRVTTAITESLDIGPTLAIWLIDRTPSAKDIVREVSAAAQNFYESPSIVRRLQTLYTPRRLGSVNLTMTG